MRIVKRAEFLAMPKGTVYAKRSGADLVFGGLSVKASEPDYFSDDWYAQKFDWVDACNSSEALDRLFEMEADASVSYPVENSICRDGLFEPAQQFLVYEPADVALIIRALQGEAT